MRRRARDGDETTPVGRGSGFQHSSGHPDLRELVAEHLLDDTAAEVTSEWTPSRRGNSPRGPRRER